MFKLQFSTDNAAFADPEFFGIEAGRIIFDVGTRMQDADGTKPIAGTIRDTNGNRVGEWSYEPSASDDREGK